MFVGYNHYRFKSKNSQRAQFNPLKTWLLIIQSFISLKQKQPVYRLISSYSESNRKVLWSFYFSVALQMWLYVQANFRINIKKYIRYIAIDLS